jgi:MFS family permease
MLIGGAVFLALFIWWELRVRDPLHNLRLFARRLYAAAATTNLFVGFSLMISLVSVPLLVNVRQEGVSFIDQAAFEAGILLSFLTVPMALAALPGGWLTDRYGYRWPAVAGLAMAVLGFTTMGLTWSGDTPYALMAVQLVVTGTGLGLTFSPVSAAAVNSAPKGERGSVSALVIIIRLVGMTISMSSLTTFALRRVSALMGDTGETFDMDAATAEVVDVTAQVIRELMLLGAAVCVLALIAAWFMRARASASAEQPAAADSIAD